MENPSEESNKPKPRWGLRILFSIGFIFGIVDIYFWLNSLLSVVNSNANSPLSFWIMSSFGILVPIVLICVSVAGLLLTK